MKFSLHHIARYPQITVEGSQRSPLLILLHGVGSNEYDLFSLAPHLSDKFLVLSVRAPHTLQPGYYAWYPVEMSATGFIYDFELVKGSREKILQFIDEAVNFYDADRERVYLMGFSQGCIMSMSILLSQPSILAGVVGMSGRILPEIKEGIASPEQLRSLPVLWVHGTRDQTLPIQNGRDANDFLASLPLTLTYREFEMGHEINAQSLQETLRWFDEQLG